MSPRFVGLRGLLLLPLVALIFAAGCASNAKKDQQKLSRYTPEVLYDRGQKALKASNYNEAVQTFEALTARYPFTPQSRQGRLDIIYAYYKLGEKESGKDAAETFIRENPTHPRIDYAWYLKGLIDFERTPYRLERWMDVTLVDRPPSTAREAFVSLRTVVERYPKSPYAADARRRMIYLRNRVADYNLGIAQYYAQRDAWVAAGTARARDHRTVRRRTSDQGCAAHHVSQLCRTGLQGTGGKHRKGVPREFSRGLHRVAQERAQLVEVLDLRSSQR